MAKIIALDVGGKRTGIAETDEMQIIATPRTTVETAQLFDYLQNWLSQEAVDTIVVGDPKNLDGGDSDNSQNVRQTVAQLRENFPSLTIKMQDERFTSKEARAAMVESGMKKKRRQQKGEVDRMSAALILRQYLEQNP